MKFSIIVPVYNVEAYLEQCIFSLLAQKSVDTQIILVDDGSTDHSGTICDQFANKHEQIQVIHQTNQGSSSARNAGISQASGDYILFVDSDDYIAINSLQLIEQEIVKQSYPDIVFLECQKVVFDKQNCIRKLAMNDGVTTSVVGLNRSDLLLFIANLPKYPASPCTKAIKRNMFSEYNLWFQNGLLHEDLEWALRLFLVIDSAGYCSNDYYFYRQHRRDSISTLRSEKNATDTLGIVEKWCTKSKKNYTTEESLLIHSLMEYVFRFLLINIRDIPRKQRSIYKKNVRACDYVLGTRKDHISKMINRFYRLFGMTLTGRLLASYLKFRSHLNNRA